MRKLIAAALTFLMATPAYAVEDSSSPSTFTTAGMLPHTVLLNDDAGKLYDGSYWKLVKVKQPFKQRHPKIYATTTAPVRYPYKAATWTSNKTKPIQPAVFTTLGSAILLAVILLRKK